MEAVAQHVVLVVTQPDRGSGRGRNLRETPVKRAASRLGLPVFTPDRARDPETISRIELLKADALLVASYGQILPEALLNAATRGGINLHASLLPKFRGAAPIQRAILDGETETGITLMQMDRGMDTGDIISMERTDILPDETAGQLEGRLATVAARMAEHWMPKVVSGDYPRHAQDHSLATLAPKLNREEGVLSFGMSAEEAYRRFRACTPRPGCTVSLRIGPLKLLDCRLTGTGPGQGIVGRGEPGEVVVGFETGGLRLRKVQLEGRPPISGQDFANGARLKPGAVLS